jgi:hypothetical protein
MHSVFTVMGEGHYIYTDNLFEILVEGKFFAHFIGADIGQRFYVEDVAA